MAEQQRARIDQAGQGANRSKKRLVLLLGVGVLILAAGGGLAWKMGLAAKFLGASEEGRQAQPVNSAEPKLGPTYSLGTFIVNLNDPVRRSYLKMKAELELSDTRVTALVDERLPQLRDTIILVLSGKSCDEIMSTEGKVRLRQELMRKLSRHLGNGTLRTIYFTEFVVQ